MRVAFRVDASKEIGTGHLMRCQTLGLELQRRGCDVRFICRAHDGNLITLLRESGLETIALETTSAGGPSIAFGDTEYACWLGTSQETDAEETIEALAYWHPDWMIIDHYGIDQRWHKKLRLHSNAIMVVDDIANRNHDCDLLLDQNLGRLVADYEQLVPSGCSVLAGPHFALLRPEFAAWRDTSLRRRSAADFGRLLINFGGVDKDGVTALVLAALKPLSLPANLEIDVVMGVTAPGLAHVRKVAAGMPWRTKVHMGVTNMAELMTRADLAIGAAGTTSWERCCLGLPVLVMALADNQKEIANALQGSGAAVYLDVDNISKGLGLFFGGAPVASALIRMSAAAAAVTEGRGCSVVCETLVARGN